MQETLRLIFVGVMTSAAIGGLALILKRSKPLVQNAGAGTIRPERSTAWLTVIGGSVMLVGGVVASIVDEEQRLAAGFLALMGLMIAGFMLPSVTSLHAVNWDEKGIDGPSNLFGPTLGLSRTKIVWADITKSGTTVTNYWYVEAKDRRRVYWS